MPYPPRLLGRDEEVLADLRPHWRVLLPALVWAMVLAAAAGAAIAALDGTWERVAVVAAPALWLLVAGRGVATWWWTSYVLTTERVVVRRGVLSRSGAQLPLEQVADVRFSQGPFERVLGAGDVLVHAVGGEQPHRLPDVADPQGLASEIRGARELHRVEAAGGDVVARLERLADLRERGHLSDEEFADCKRRLLERDD